MIKAHILLVILSLVSSGPIGDREKRQSCGCACDCQLRLQQNMCNCQQIPNCPTCTVQVEVVHQQSQQSPCICQPAQSPCGFCPPPIQQDPCCPQTQPAYDCSQTPQQSPCIPSMEQQNPCCQQIPQSACPCQTVQENPCSSCQPIQNNPCSSCQPIQNNPCPSCQPIQNNPCPSCQPIQNNPCPSCQPVLENPCPSCQPACDPCSETQYSQPVMQLQVPQVMQCVPACQPACQQSCSVQYSNQITQYSQPTTSCDSQQCICQRGYVKCAEQTCCLRYRYTQRKAKRSVVPSGVVPDLCDHLLHNVNNSPVSLNNEIQA
uniref:Proline-rich protein 9 n=1 Tax=Heterorhabditis bacteriophora TaxID=37862 RepID=A0A1I7XGR1_HETBA